MGDELELDYEAIPEDSAVDEGLSADTSIGFHVPHNTGQGVGEFTLAINSNRLRIAPLTVRSIPAGDLEGLKVRANLLFYALLITISKSLSDPEAHIKETQFFASGDKHPYGHATLQVNGNSFLKASVGATVRIVVPFKSKGTVDAVLHYIKNNVATDIGSLLSNKLINAPLEAYNNRQDRVREHDAIGSARAVIIDYMGQH